MRKLSLENLLKLEDYAQQRDQIRQEIILHKKSRRLVLGPHVSLHFEDFRTMFYQTQEMLRIERIFDRKEIQLEIDTYNDLIPDGSNWKATMLLEYEDVEVRARELAKLIGVEHKVFVRIGDGENQYAYANEDMPRSNEGKTAAVHFLRFEFANESIQSMKAGNSVHIGIDHPLLAYEKEISENQREVLLKDFDS